MEYKTQLIFYMSSLARNAINIEILCWKFQYHLFTENTFIQSVPNLWWFALGFFDLKMMWKRYSVETSLWICISLFSRASTHGVVLCGDAGQRQRAAAPSQPRGHKGQRPLLCSVLVVLDDSAWPCVGWCACEVGTSPRPQSLRTCIVNISNALLPT